MTDLILSPLRGKLLLVAVASMTDAAPADAQRNARPIADPSLAAFRVDSAATSLPARVLSLNPAPFVSALHAARPAGFSALVVQRAGARECLPDISYDADEHFLTVMLRVVKAEPGPADGRRPISLPVLTVRCHGAAPANAPVMPYLTVGAADLEQARDSHGDVMVQAEVAPGDLPAVRRSLAVVLVFELGVHSPLGVVFPATRVGPTRRDAVPGAAATVDVLWARNLSAWLIDGRTSRVLTKRSLGEPRAERP